MDDEKNWLAADYVLGVLRGAEKTEFEYSLKQDTELADLVVQWQKRLDLVQPSQGDFCPTMSEAEVDDALERVFQKVCSAIDVASTGQSVVPASLASLGKEQLRTLRPVVARLIASYLVILERLKIQQANLAGQA